MLVGRDIVVRRGAGALALAVVLLVPGARAESPDRAGTTPRQGRTRAAYARLPLTFVPASDDADGLGGFVARGPGYTVALRAAEAVLAFARPSGSPDAPVAVRLRLLATRPAPAPAGEAPAGTVNYLVGSDPARWRAGLPAYQRVRYREVYPGIDLVYYGNQRELEYDFVVAAGAEPAQIRFAVDGAGAIIDAGGDLVLDTPAGRARLRRPVLYQERDGRRTPVTGRFARREAGAFGFDVDAYDRSRPLVIDPVLAYSTYLGGVNADSAYALAVDAAGHAYVAGYTLSPDFPAPGSTAGPRGADAFVSKLTPDGSGLVFTTFVGGSGYDQALGVAVDAGGNVLLVGSTTSLDFPAVNAAQPLFGGTGQAPACSPRCMVSDAFVTRLDATGSRIVYSTYLGGTGSESAGGIAVDAAGNVYVAGGGSSTDFATRFHLHPTARGGPFAVKLAPDGALAYSIDFGPSPPGGVGGAAGIAMDAAGHAYVVGTTQASDFPTTPGAFQRTLAGGPCFAGQPCTDAFVVKLNPSGSAAVYATLLGGARDDAGQAIAVDGTGSAYVAGYTESTDFPILSAFQAAHGGGQCSFDRRPCADAFVTKLRPDGSALVYSTYLGGSGHDSAGALALDTAGRVHLAGVTFSPDFPTAEPLQATLGGRVCETSECGDGFVAVLDASGGRLVIGTYLGGDGVDAASAIAVDAAGHTYVAGTADRNFPLVSPFQTTASGWDAFVAKLTWPEPPTGPPTGPPGAGRRSLSVVVRGVDGGIYHARLEGTTWQDWLRLTGETADAPALAMNRGMLELVVRGTDNGIYHSRFDGTAWREWTRLPGATAATPALATNGGMLELVVRGMDDAIYHSRFDGTAWTEWTRLPGATAAAPALAVNGGTLELVVRGTDGGIYHSRFDGTAWQEWQRLPGLTPDTPALATSGGNLELVVRGMDDGIYHNRFDGTRWLGWAPVAGSTRDVPALLPEGRGLLLVVRGTDDGVYVSRFDGAGWLPPTQLPGGTASGPAAVTSGDGAVHLVLRGTDDAIYHNRLGGDGVSWIGYDSVQGATASRPGVASD